MGRRHGEQEWSREEKTASFGSKLAMNQGKPRQKLTHVIFKSCYTIKVSEQQTEYLYLHFGHTKTK